jgi:uncharacterized damage-inducible protein DinB
MIDSRTREQLSEMLEWSSAHVTLEGAVAGVPIELRGSRVDGFPHSLWELLEHIRFAQEDILNFCLDPDYREPAWPEEYWPRSAAPPDADSWELSIGKLQRDRAKLQSLARDPGVDLSSEIPHGSGQTYLRELLLVADHTSYHVGQIVAVRRILGIWGAD